MSVGRFMIIAAALAVATACERKEDAPAAAPQSAPAAVPTTAPEQSATAGFKLDSVPVSTAALGDFPYFVLPKGYLAGKPETVDFGRFPIWVGDRTEWVEGKIYQSYVQAENGKNPSPLEVERNIDALVSQIGGVKVFNGLLPKEALSAFDDATQRAYAKGLQYYYREPVNIYLVRRADRNIWVFLTPTSWVIVESAPVAITASLLASDALKQQIDATGKVAIQVNFAVDKADILPDSQPQIDQVVELLKKDPALKLSIEGHTDNTGVAARNKTLSEARAKSVVAALTAKGVAASRLSAKGFGQDKPVADNGTEEGRAKNRRVELVKA